MQSNQCPFSDGLNPVIKAAGRACVYKGFALCNASALVSEEVLLPHNYAYSKQEAVKTKPSDST